MMGFNPTTPIIISPSSSVHDHDLYPEELQLKLYQAFIFSIPILVLIILLLLLYLFYLKRTPPPFLSPLPTTTTTTSTSAQLNSYLNERFISRLKLKQHKVANLETVLLDQVLTTATDSTCCVCLGEFEREDVLHQIPACRHVFHADCIRLWLISNTTCPLCRCFIPFLSIQPQSSSFLTA